MPSHMKMKISKGLFQIFRKAISALASLNLKSTTAGAKRHAVIMHADVVGSTDLVRNDIDLAHVSMQSLYTRLSRIARAWNGKPMELRGDAAVLEFPTAREAVMVGDRQYDIWGAQQHDLATIGVAYGYGARAELEEAGADIVCDDVAAVHDALQSYL